MLFYPNKFTDIFQVLSKSETSSKELLFLCENRISVMDPSFDQTFLFFKEGLFETQIIELSDCNVLFALDIHEDGYQIVAQVNVGVQYLFFLRTIHNRHSSHPIDFICLK